jgi:uncharacterized protein
MSSSGVGSDIEWQLTKREQSMLSRRSFSLTGLALASAIYLASCDMTGPIRTPSPKTFYSDPQIVQLIEAIETEDLPEIGRLVAAGADINAAGSNGTDWRDKEGVTPLLWAYLQHRKASFRRLLELGADPNQALLGHGSVMSNGARNEDLYWLRLALEHSGNPNLLDTENETPIFRAVVAHQLENIKVLVQAGADLNHQDTVGSAPLIAAAQLSWFEAVDYLLKAGADYSVKSDPNSPSDFAYYIIRRPIPRESTQWSWRENVISFLEEKGFDFEPARLQVAKTDPFAAELWREEMQQRHSDKGSPPGHP